jgi:hypothetical protein
MNLGEMRFKNLYRVISKYDEVELNNCSCYKETVFDGSNDINITCYDFCLQRPSNYEIYWKLVSVLLWPLQSYASRLCNKIEYYWNRAESNSSGKILSLADPTGRCCVLNDSFIDQFFNIYILSLMINQCLKYWNHHWSHRAILPRTTLQLKTKHEISSS